MRLSRSILPLALFLSLHSLAGIAGEPFRIMTFNIRYNNPDDSIYSWDNRKEMVFWVLGKYHPDVIGFQEVLKGQAEDLMAALPGYRMEGVGRDDGRAAGEYAPVFYNTRRFTAEQGSTFWLSETPSVPGSRSWGAACTRIVTWVCLTDKVTHMTWYVFNTHFDHVSEEARQHSAVLLLDSIRVIAGNNPVLLTGDFNSNEQSQAYQALTADPSFHLYDTGQINPRQDSGPDCTFVGFPARFDAGNVIDFIFTSKPGTFKVDRHQVVDDHLEDQYPSDHLPVLVTITE